MKNRDDEVGDRVLVALEEVSVIRGGRALLDAVSLALLPGEVVTLVGRNGAGKTTLVRTLLGLIRPDRGRVRRRAGLRVGYTPQGVHRDPSLPLTVAGFMALGRHRDPGAIRTALAAVGIEARAGTLLAELSGGEAQRVMLARALLGEPELLVLDEPLAGIDLHARVELYRLIGEARERHGCAVLMVSHDLHVVMAATDRVVCLDHHVCCTGRPAAVAADPRFQALFGAEVAAATALYVHHHDHRHAPGGGAARGGP